MEVSFNLTITFISSVLQLQLCIQSLVGLNTKLPGRLTSIKQAARKTCAVECLICPLFAVTKTREVQIGISLNQCTN